MLQEIMMLKILLKILLQMHIKMLKMSTIYHLQQKMLLTRVSR
jgi:hypothetical protein